MVSNKFQLHVFEVLFLFLAFISLAFFIKALDTKYQQFFSDYNNMILLFSGLSLLLFLIVNRIIFYSNKKRNSGVLNE